MGDVASRVQLREKFGREEMAAAVRQGVPVVVEIEGGRGRHALLILGLKEVPEKKAQSFLALDSNYPCELREILKTEKGWRYPSWDIPKEKRASARTDAIERNEGRLGEIVYNVNYNRMRGRELSDVLFDITGRAVWMPLVDGVKLYRAYLEILKATSSESFGSEEVTVRVVSEAAVRTQALVSERKEKKQAARALKP
jgi:hypothetical protein